MTTTTIISIPGLAVGGVLKFINENSIPCNYVGIDQSGRLLMEIAPDESHKAIMKEITLWMEKCEEFINEAEMVFKEIIRMRKEEIKKTFQEARNKFKVKEGNQHQQ